MEYGGDSVPARGVPASFIEKEIIKKKEKKKPTLKLLNALYIVYRYIYLFIETLFIVF